MKPLSEIPFQEVSRMSAVAIMAKKNAKGRGRPKGSGTGGLGDRFAVKISPEYKVWLGEFAGSLNAEMADVFREALRRYAEAKGFREPPLR